MGRVEHANTHVTMLIRLQMMLYDNCGQVAVSLGFARGMLRAFQPGRSSL